MSITSIVAIIAIVVFSVAAVFVSQEPLDEVFHLEASMNGFPVQPLATKVTLHPDDEVKLVTMSPVAAEPCEEAVEAPVEASIAEPVAKPVTKPSAAKSDAAKRFVTRAA